MIIELLNTIVMTHCLIGMITWSGLIEKENLVVAKCWRNELTFVFFLCVFCLFYGAITGLIFANWFPVFWFLITRQYIFMFGGICDFFKYLSKEVKSN